MALTLLHPLSLLEKLLRSLFPEHELQHLMVHCGHSISILASSVIISVGNSVSYIIALFKKNNSCQITNMTQTPISLTTFSSLTP